MPSFRKVLHLYSCKVSTEVQRVQILERKPNLPEKTSNALFEEVTNPKRKIEVATPLTALIKLH